MEVLDEKISVSAAAIVDRKTGRIRISHLEKQSPKEKNNDNLAKQQKGGKIPAYKQDDSSKMCVARNQDHPLHRIFSSLSSALYNPLSPFRVCSSLCELEWMQD